MSLALFYNHVTVLDYAYLELERGVVGDSLIVNVEFEGHTDEEGVIYDFSWAKKKVKEIIDRECDHRLVVPTKSKHLQLEKGERASLLFKSEMGDISYHCPEQGLCLVESEKIDFHSLGKFLEKVILPEMPQEVKVVHIEFEKEEACTPKDIFFHYTHGLKQHYGNCQRLLHGHRSTLKVYSGGLRDNDTENWLCEEQFRHSIHFAFWENVENKKEVEKLFVSGRSGALKEGGEVKVSYKASQGDFSCLLPSGLVHIVPMETTVENLSTYFYQCCIAKEVPQEDLLVQAYEGIGKGAKTAT